MSAARRAEDIRWMRLALSLGRRGMGRVWPNPAVGCVLVRDGHVVGRGWTQDGGRPHAEAFALAQSGQAARGATAYVTLEPCSHTGKTPPCADALIAAGVARVVVAAGDPDTRVSGRGIARLKEAGIAVTTGLLEAEARRDHAGFLKRVEQGLPFVTLKLASSVDGRIATKTGESQWITGPEARRAVHAMRARHDAVMVGAGTARADAPSLTVRGLGVARQPVRVVVSTALDLPLEGPLAETAGDVPVWQIHGSDAPKAAQVAWQACGAKLLCAPGPEVSARAALALLAAEGITRVFCEGGGELAAALLREGLVDELVTFTAGLAIGGDGLASVAPLGFGPLAYAPRFQLTELRPVGGDALQIWRTKPV